MKFNCAKCPGYCCSHGRIAVTDHDIRRLARFFGTSARLARRRVSYRYRAGEVDEIANHHEDREAGNRRDPDPAVQPVCVRLSAPARAAATKSAKSRRAQSRSRYSSSG